MGIRNLGNFFIEQQKMDLDLLNFINFVMEKEKQFQLLNLQMATSLVDMLQEVGIKLVLMNMMQKVSSSLL